MEVQEKKGYCTLCRSRCGTINIVRDGQMTEVRPDRDHPTGHAMCLKGKSAPELVHSPHRVLYPMRRTTPKSADDPGWVRIGWEEALDEIASRLDTLRREHGAETVAFGVTTPSGTPMSDSIDWVERFIWSYGSPNICYATEICNWHKDVAHMFTFGCGMPTADYRHAEVVMLWGTNPANTWLAQADAIAEGRRNGARMIVVDPRPTALAQQADVWLRVRPGTDAALALGIAREMIATRMFDETFVRTWTNAPLLVRCDNGLFLRERDIDPDSNANRYVIWNATRARAEIIGEEDDTSPQEFALSGIYTITSIECEPAFACYARALDAYTPEHVEAITGVAPHDLIEAAMLLASNRRIAYHAWSGVGQHTNATQTERAIATLYALTGSFDTRGSNREFVKQPANAVSTYALLAPQQRAKALGLDERPLGPPAQGWVTARDMYRAMLDAEPYKVRAFFAFGTNPLVSQPDRALAHEALSTLEFHVHCDLYETPSSKYADIFLPINTPWEREGLRIGFEIDERAVELVQLRQRMVEPRGESRADYDIVFALAVRLGMRDRFFDGSIEAGWDHMLAPLGLDVKTLRAHPEGIYRPLEQREKQYATPTADGARGFRTETLRVELYSEKLLRHGYPPVPAYVPPDGLAPDTRDPAYPYVLTSTKNGYYCHSQHRGLTRLRRRAPHPVVEMSATLAAKKGIEANDWILIRTPNGSARFVAHIESSLADDVLIAEYGWWQACDELGMNGYPASGAGNSNFSNLVSSKAYDPLSGSMPMRALACDIAPDPSFDRARRAWQGWREFIVTDLADEADGVRTVTLAAKDGGVLPDYMPGQHVSVRLPKLGTTRAYSLVGHAEQDARRTYTISVRHQRSDAFEGVMSGHIHRALEVGHDVSLRAPSGTFVLPMTSRQPVVIFAGGIGMTPFIAYLETLARAASKRQPDVWLFYANGHGGTHAFRNRIAQLRAMLPSLEVLDYYAHPRPGDTFDRSGYLDASAVSDDLIQRRARFYLCGPEPMMASVTDGLIARGVPAFDIFKEAFRSPTELRADASQRFMVKFARSDKSAQWTPARGSLLTFAEELGVSLPSGCRVGQCESCAVRIASGTTNHLSGNVPDEPDMCFACQAVPSSDLVIEA